MMQMELEKYFDKLWPICRSITGIGLRESFKILQEIIPLELQEEPTGKLVYDWEIPKEWNIEDAYIVTQNGKKICDFQKNNLHVVNYSIPVDKMVSWDELEKHLHTLPKQPNAVPYVTSYYKENWGFCITYDEYQKLSKEGNYKVVIKSKLEPGSLTWGQCVLPGESNDEILFSSYLCHPSMANNELSGPLALAFLYQELAKIPKRKNTYRFVLAPETIGIIAFLAKEGEELKNHLKAGYVLTCCGDAGKITYQRSKDISHEVNTVVEHLLQHTQNDFHVRNFQIGGSDERQYNSPGFKLPVGTLMRTPYKLFKEYHTSLDNKDFISFPHLAQFITFCVQVCEAHEINQKYMGAVQHGEPMLGKRGLYDSEGAWMKSNEFRYRLLCFLSYADGDTSLLSLANYLEQNILEFKPVVNVSMENNLLI